MLGNLKKVKKNTKTKPDKSSSQIVETQQKRVSNVNENLHLNPSVPEEVQEFIKKISSETPSSIKIKDNNLLDVEDDRFIIN